MACQTRQGAVSVVESNIHAFQSVTREPSLSDKVAEQLTEAIVSRQIKAGDRLPSERDLADRFKVSRTVIREAVRSLSARGLVRVTSGRGVEVNQFGAGDVAASMRLLVRGHEEVDYGKVNEVRTALEVQVAGLAAQRALPDHIERLGKLCDEHERNLEQGKPDAAAECDFQFHRELTRSSGNVLLLAMLDSIADVLREVRNKSMTEPHVGKDGLRAHRRILKCVSAGKPEAARSAMIEHLAEAERVWQDMEVRANKTTPRGTKRTNK